VKETQSQLNLPGVPKAKQGREVPPQWAWTQASVWTERMLATLKRGIKGGKWFSLMDKVWKMENLQSACKSVARNRGGSGVDGQKIESFLSKGPERLAQMQEQLKTGQYTPRPVKRVWIPKLGSKELRPLGVPTVEDRIAQTAIRNVIEPIFENTFAQHSYGFRPGRGAKDALRRVDQLLKSGRVWVVDADLKACFDTIPQDKLMERVQEHIADGPLLDLIQQFLKQGVMESGRGWQPTEAGTPQGAVISPLLANIYLNPLDHLMAQAGKEMVRYADDFVVLCQTQEEAQETLEQLRAWVEQAGLKLHPTKTRIVDASQKGGFDFLGYHFERGARWPRQKSLLKFRENIRQKTGRLRPGHMSQIITEVNRTLRGWFEYFKHSNRTTFRNLDCWVRGRLRSILTHRTGQSRTGRWRIADHRRWPLAYFADLGLISLASAQSKASQSPTRDHRLESRMP
jgi:RNA-directed DNA polymerase